MTVKRNRDNSSSSEDEELQKALKEATDHTLFENTGLSAPKSETPKRIDEHKKNKSSAKSLRRNLEEQTNQFSNFGATPTFQNYVAKKLNEILENSIEVNNTVEDAIIVKGGENDDSGIKLLNSSVKYITAEEEVEKPQRRRIIAALDDEENYLKCKEVAVDPEWILSQVETKAWTSRRKPEFKYERLESGILVEKS